MFLIFTITFLGLLAFSQEARILGVIPTPTYSHQVVPQSIWRELSLRGHQVVVITTYPMNDPTLTNLTEIDVSFVQKPNDITKLLTKTGGSVLTILDQMLQVYEKYETDMLGSDAVQDLLKNKSEQFDVVIVEYLFPNVVAFQHRFNCSMIGITPLESTARGHDDMGNPTHPILYPEIIFPYITQPSFIERLKIMSTQLFFFIFALFYNFRSDELVRTYFGENYPSTETLRSNLDLLLINANPAFHNVRPVVPGTIYIGSGLHMTAPKDLSDELQTYLDSSEQGVIYFSLGSSLRTADIPTERLQIIVETLKELPYNILWKFEDESLINVKPNNVKIIKWAPQQDILRHPNVKAFITQAGLQSVEEAIFTHTPVVAMPIKKEQLMNARVLNSKGCGLIVDYNNLRKEDFKRTIIEVVHNKTFLDNIRTFADLLQDQPMTGLEKAIWWIEYVIRHKGAKHFKGPMVNLPLYQYYFLDVITYALGCLIVLYFVCKFVQKLVKACYRSYRWWRYEKEEIKSKTS